MPELSVSESPLANIPAAQASSHAGAALLQQHCNPARGKFAWRHAVLAPASPKHIKQGQRGLGAYRFKPGEPAFAAAASAAFRSLRKLAARFSALLASSYCFIFLSCCAHRPHTSSVTCPSFYSSRTQEGRSKPGYLFQGCFTGHAHYPQIQGPGRQEGLLVVQDHLVVAAGHGKEAAAQQHAVQDEAKGAKAHEAH